MTKSLADMVSELSEDVPAVAGVPSEAQYERAVKDAVREFARRCGFEKTGTLSIVSGTATYDLPADFLSMIEMDSPWEAENEAIITSNGIIPFNGLSPFEEDTSIQNGQITFVPTPTYTMKRYFEYKAGWELGEDGTYPLTDKEAAIVMLKARQLCFDKLANASAGGFKYSVGNMSVDKSGTADSYTKRLYELQGEFVIACNQYNGQVME